MNLWVILIEALVFAGLFTAILFVYFRGDRGLAYHIGELNKNKTTSDLRPAQIGGRFLFSAVFSDGLSREREWRRSSPRSGRARSCRRPRARSPR